MTRFADRISSHAAKIMVVAMLATPAILSVVGNTNKTSENRTLTDFPERPRTLDAALKYPLRLDAWINDHFGFRNTLLKWNNRIRYALFNEFPTNQVIQGKEGRIFLAAHATTHPRYSNIMIGCGYQTIDTNGVASQMNRFATVFAQLGTDARLMVVPSAAALYTDALPDWIASRCSDAGAPVPKILSSPVLTPAASTQVYYPIDAMREIERTTHVIPNTWFHWAGTGPRRVAEASARHLWNIPTAKSVAIPSKMMYRSSDISHLFPGIALGSDIEVADYAGSGIDACIGGRCFDELASIMNRLGDVSYYRNERAPGGRLVLFSDSFGAHIAGWYASHFREVVHVSTNNLEQLSRDELATLRTMLLSPRPESHLLFIYHDASVLVGRLGADLDKLGL